MLSLPASKGFEIGSGFAATRMKGSEHNDPFEVRDAESSDHDESIPAACRVASPTARTSSSGSRSSRPSTIAREQRTVTTSQEETTLAARGRHDPCVLPRAVPIVEAMAALVLCDHALRQRAISNFGFRIPDFGETKTPL